MRDQVAALRRKGIAAVSLGVDTAEEELAKIKEGQ